MSHNTIRLRRIRLGAVIVAGSFLLLACGSNDDSGDGPVIGVHELTRGSNGVGLNGTIVVVDGCLMLQPEDDAADPIMLAWPPGSSSSTTDGMGVVRDDSGDVLATVGESVQLTGGPLGEADITTPDGSDLPEDCVTKHMFAVAQS